MTATIRLLKGLLLLAILVGVAFALLHSGVYGWTIFVLLPVLLGGLASWMFQPPTGTRAAGLGAVAVMFALFALLLVRSEGLICIAMVLPLALPLGAFGGWLVFRLGSPGLAASGTAMLLLLPAGLTWDTTASPPTFEVRTAIEIAATPEQVWKHVVAFSDLPKPQGWFFRAGLAYPKRAHIVGSGPGAVRYCEFSTGPFIEPIEIWDEPRLLRFRVTENPAPMQEWSFYGRIFPRHLRGYFISKQGQFRLIPLANRHTLLEGTTWYQHGLWPAGYWRLWSDAIIHRIHLRVLNHIKLLAEPAS